MSNQFSHYFIFLCLLLFMGCSVKPKGHFVVEKIPSPPDYSNPDHWAALPDKNDMADSLASAKFIDRQAESKVDVFFLHPTTYTGSRGQNQWNGSIDAPSLIKKTDEGTILFQASIFNGVGKVYAPRYRQGHIHLYYEKKRKEDAAKAFELAYTDVKKAFEYYLKNYNNGRPILIAAHSQGTSHAKRLLKEYFDGKSLEKQLVAAYLVGIAVEKNEFKNIPICESAEETGCYCAWRTYQTGFYPKKFHPRDNNFGVTNPISWTTDTIKIPMDQNLGGLVPPFDDGITKNIASAQIHNGLLWTDKPKFHRSFFYLTKNYHIGDYNLYYVNVRENAILRAKNYIIHFNRNF